MNGKILDVMCMDDDLVFVLRRRKRLDIIIAEDVKSKILRSVDKKYKRIIFDLEAVHFIDSTAVAMLMDLNGILTESGYHFSITNISNDMMELLQLVPILKSLIINTPGKITSPLTAS